MSNFSDYFTLLKQEVVTGTTLSSPNRQEITLKAVEIKGSKGGSKDGFDQECWDKYLEASGKEETAELYFEYLGTLKDGKTARDENGDCIGVDNDHAVFQFSTFLLSLLSVQLMLL